MTAPTLDEERALGDTVPASRLPSGWNWRGWAGGNARGLEWNTAHASMTNALRRYLGDGLDKAGEERDLPPEELDRLRSWAQEVNVSNLVEWLDARDGWKREGLEADAEGAFVKAALGIRRRFYLARLEAAAQRNRAAATLFNDPARLDKVLGHLVKPSRPLLQERFGARRAEDWVTIYMRADGRLPQDQMGHVVLFPCLPRKSDVPAGTTTRLRPTAVPIGIDPNFSVPVAWWLGLDVLRGLLTAQEWALLWAFHSDREGERWLRVLALNWLDERLERAQETHAAKPFSIQPRNVVHTRSGADFLRFPSMLKDAGAWCSSLVEIEDEGTVFAQEPDLQGGLMDEHGAPLRVYQPKAWTIAPEHVIGHDRQLALPGFSLDPERNQDLAAFLAVAATDAAAADPRLPGVCAKLLPLLFALCPLDGTPVKGTHRDLAKLLWPNWRERRAMPDDCERVGKAAAALRQLRIVERIPNRPPRVYPVLSGGFWDLSASPDVEVSFGMNPSLQALVRPERGVGNFMLVNLSRLMDLDATSPATIALALRLYAVWHGWKQKGVWAPNRADFLSVDDLLVTAAVIDDRVAQVVAGDTTQGHEGLRKRADARAQLVDVMLPRLEAARITGSVEVKRPPKGSRGKSWLVKPLPPKDYLEASQRVIAGKRSRPKR